MGAMADNPSRAPVIIHRPEPGAARLHRRGKSRLRPAAIRSRANAITRMLFAVATPMHMMAPVSAGTD